MAFREASILNKPSELTDWLTLPEQPDNLSVCCTYHQVLSISFPQTEMSLHGALLSPKITIVLFLPK